MPQKVLIAVTLAVAVLTFAGSPRGADAGEDGAFLGAFTLRGHPIDPRGLPILELDCFELLTARMKVAGDGSDSSGRFDRVMHTPAFRACMERELTFHELGF